MLMCLVIGSKVLKCLGRIACHLPGCEEAPKLSESQILREKVLGTRNKTILYLIVISVSGCLLLV